MSVLGTGSLWGADPGVEMLQKLKTRDAATLWDSTAPPSDSEAHANKPSKTLASDSDQPAGWHATATPSPTAGPGGNGARVAQQDPPAIPRVYDPPPTKPAPRGGQSSVPEPEFPPIPNTPKELRDIETIAPYFDYDPTPNPNAPFEHICPRPNGVPCKNCEDDGKSRPCPDVVPLDEGPFVGRTMPASVFAWKATNLRHNPLYFRDIALQRYGHTYGKFIQPAVSVTRFGAQLLALPYQMTLAPPCKEVYPLGYYRPGEPAPKLFYQPPLNAKAAAVTAAAYTGFGFVFP